MQVNHGLVCSAVPVVVFLKQRLDGKAALWKAGSDAAAAGSGRRAPRGGRARGHLVIIQVGHGFGLNEALVFGNAVGHRVSRHLHTPRRQAVAVEVRLALQVQDASADRADDVRRDELSSVDLVHLAVELEKPRRIVRPTPVQAR